VFSQVIVVVWLLRKVKARRPRLGVLATIATIFVGLTITDTLVEGLVLRTGAYAYPGGIRAITLFAGHTYQIPLSETVLFGGVALGAIACLSHFRNDLGQTAAERGIDTLKLSFTGKQAVKFFAIYGAVHLGFVGALHGSAAVVRHAFGPVPARLSVLHGQRHVRRRRRRKDLPRTRRADAEARPQPLIDGARAVAPHRLWIDALRGGMSVAKRVQLAAVWAGPVFFVLYLVGFARIRPVRPASGALVECGEGRRGDHRSHDSDPRRDGARARRHDLVNPVLRGDLDSDRPHRARAATVGGHAVRGSRAVGGFLSVVWNALGRSNFPL
jgi:hypothetical protein